MENIVNHVKYYGINQYGQPKFSNTVVQLEQLHTHWKIGSKERSLAWDDYINNGADYEGITSPEREFDRAWNKWTLEFLIVYVE